GSRQPRAPARRRARGSKETARRQSQARAGGGEIRANRRRHCAQRIRFVSAASLQRWITNRDGKDRTCQELAQGEVWWPDLLYRECPRHLECGARRSWNGCHPPPRVRERARSDPRVLLTFQERSKELPAARGRPHHGTKTENPLIHHELIQNRKR